MLKLRYTASKEGKLLEYEVLHDSNFIVGWKDLEGHYHDCNTELKCFAGSDLEGENDETMRWSRHASILRMQDIEVAETKKPKIYCHEITLKNKEETDIFSLKCPLYISRKLIGVAFLARTIRNGDFVNCLEHISSYFSSAVNFDMTGMKMLSAREKDWLRYYLAGYTKKEAAIKMGIADRTVEGYHENVKYKLGVEKRNEIYKRARKLGIEASE